VDRDYMPSDLIGLMESIRYSGTAIIFKYDLDGVTNFATTVDGGGKSLTTHLNIGPGRRRLPALELPAKRQLTNGQLTLPDEDLFVHFCSERWRIRSAAPRPIPQSPAAPTSTSGSDRNPSGGEC
jgi:hypothetical protein